MSKKNITVTDVFLPIISAIIALGTVFVFHACGAKEDGGFMSCHWAERVVFGLGCVMTFISCVHLGAKSAEAKTSVSLSLAATAVFTALVPDAVIKLCMMKDMRCHTVMHPSITVLCVILTVVCVIDIFNQTKRGNMKK